MLVRNTLDPITYQRSILFVGPRHGGKSTLIHAYMFKDKGINLQWQHELIITKIWTWPNQRTDEQPNQINDEHVLCVTVCSVDAWTTHSSKDTVMYEQRIRRSLPLLWITSEQPSLSFRCWTIWFWYTWQVYAFVSGYTTLHPAVTISPPTSKLPHTPLPSTYAQFP